MAKFENFTTDLNTPLLNNMVSEGFGVCSVSVKLKNDKTGKVFEVDLQAEFMCFFAFAQCAGLNVEDAFSEAKKMFLLAINKENDLDRH